MLHHSTGAGRYRIMGIDPGGDTIGMCVLGYDVTTSEVTLEYAETLKASRLVKHYRHLEEVHGDRFIRQLIIQHHLQTVIDTYTPKSIASEAPFLGRFPQAFASLTECLQLLRLIVFRYDPGMVFDTVDPPSVKNAVGVQGKTNDKTLVANAVAALPMTNATGRPISLCDEHTTDAIAVAWWRLSKILPELKVPHEEPPPPPRKRRRKRKGKKT